MFSTVNINLLQLRLRAHVGIKKYICNLHEVSELPNGQVCENASVRVKGMDRAENRSVMASWVMNTRLNTDAILDLINATTYQLYDNGLLELLVKLHY
jgi:hypothetical protein